MVAIVVAGGSGPSSVPPWLDDASVCVAADSGLELAERLGLEPDLVLGDLDSVDDATLAAAQARGVEVRRAPVDKDETDLELALQAAGEAGVDKVVVLGGGGGRLDHLLGVMAAMAKVARAGVDVVACHGDATLFLVGGDRRLEVELESELTLSLIPLGAPATGVTATGVVWPLRGECLWVDEARGVSNRTLAGSGHPPLRVDVTTGVLAVVIPGGVPLGTHRFARLDDGERPRSSPRPGPPIPLGDPPAAPRGGSDE